MTRILSLLILIAALLANPSVANADSAVPQSRAQIALSFAPLVKQVTPSVVNIYTQKLVQQRVSPLLDDPLFRQFFGEATPQGMTRQRMENSLGSGVIVGSDGLIVTSRHVIAGAAQIRVVLSDRREFDAKIVMTDEHADLALLRIDTKGETLPILELKDSDDAQVGDLVLAIGNPFGVGQTVTMGIISALTHKSVGSNDLGYFIQTDAAINPGNSGGALVTMDGKLTGINAAIYSRDGGNMGIGFAVPSNMVRLLVNAQTQGDNKGKKSITHPWLGVEGQAITQDIALSLGMAQPTGVLVKNIHPASPALRAGLRIGDVITSINGHDVEDPEAFHYRTTALPVGSTATFGIVRAGQKSTISIDMIAPPEDPPRDEALITGQNAISGGTIANLSPAVAEEFDIQHAPEHGVVVLSIKNGSSAANLGLHVGDILVAINGIPVSNMKEITTTLRQLKGTWQLTLRRKGSDIAITFSQ